MDTWEVFFLIIFAVLIYCLFSGKRSPTLKGGNKIIGRGKQYEDDLNQIQRHVEDLLESNSQAHMQQADIFNDVKQKIGQFKRKYNCEERINPVGPLIEEERKSFKFNLYDAGERSNKKSMLRYEQPIPTDSSNSFLQKATPTDVSNPFTKGNQSEIVSRASQPVKLSQVSPVPSPSDRSNPFLPRIGTQHTSTTPSDVTNPFRDALQKSSQLQDYQKEFQQRLGSFDLQGSDQESSRSFRSEKSDQQRLHQLALIAQHSAEHAEGNDDVQHDSPVIKEQSKESSNSSNEESKLFQSKEIPLFNRRQNEQITAQATPAATTDENEEVKQQQQNMFQGLTPLRRNPAMHQIDQRDRRAQVISNAVPLRSNNATPVNLEQYEKMSREEQKQHRAKLSNSEFNDLLSAITAQSQQQRQQRMDQYAQQRMDIGQNALRRPAQAYTPPSQGYTPLRRPAQAYVPPQQGYTPLRMAPSSNIGQNAPRQYNY